MRQIQQDYGSRILYELLSSNVLRSPFDFSKSRRPASFASLMLGISLTLMLSGSVTFFIGFFMMPWVLGLVMFLYLVGVVSTIGRAILCCTSSPPKGPSSFVRLSICWFIQKDFSLQLTT